MSAFLAWRLGGKIFFFITPTATVKKKKLRLLAGDQVQLEYTYPLPPPPSLMRNVIVLSPSEMSEERKARVSYAIRMSHNLNTVRRVQKLC
jgi:hypothetical protein